MLVFAASDKGGTGRSVTSANLLHQAALLGDDVCFLDFDFDFGAPTAGANFGLNGFERGTGPGRGCTLTSITASPPAGWTCGGTPGAWVADRRGRDGWCCFPATRAAASSPSRRRTR
ncbi:hypothetical protein Ari01nite_78660 [Paractinoplanes rishiriensis]|uniref:CobQ/CobB/MinD/ParA nucleotide binding domain-containing protein n=1 Tax=Paractinoplanes rishiriensis TaxID=1050105 RepID=A0A919MUJ4_9ACTN|nr:hypothetical protein Ari01nite_78660 [Actinoplanes rishiriensis]